MTILSFLFFTVMVGLATMYLVRKQDTRQAEGYFLGGRSLPWFAVTSSMYLTNISTEQMVGLNGGAYQSGMDVMGWEVPSAIALVLLALVLMPIYMRHGITTLPQLLEHRYGRSIRITMAIAAILGLVVVILPFVLYTGALSLVSLVQMEQLTGLDHHTCVITIAVALALIGGSYAVFGGLKAIAVSDSIYGVGLIAGGVMVPLFALLQLGGGSFLEGLSAAQQAGGAKFNAITGPDSAVPFTTLFTGMALINVGYWCMDQNIIQRAFGARSLAEAQKGVLCTGLCKILGVSILIVPGILAFGLSKGKLPHSDMAYPWLVQQVLPVWLLGFFGAVVFGAILSSFNSSLHAVSTLFSVDIYPTMIRKNASSRETVLVGKTLGTILTLASIGVVPLLGETEGGIFQLMKQIGGFLFPGVFSTIVMGLVFARSTPAAPLVGLPVGAALYGYFVWYRNGVVYADVHFHWLHLVAANTLVVFLLMLLIRACVPAPAGGEQTPRLTTDIDLTPWPLAKWAGAGLVLLVIAIYWLFSPLGIAS